MKKIKIYLSFLAVFALLFTSCSKEENSVVNDDSGKATLSFGAIVQDLAGKSANKQSDTGMPECTDDVPAYVEIVLMQGESAVVGSVADPHRVDLVAGQIFTEEDTALELEPGNYSLDHFSVYNADGDLIWLAPKGGDLAELVDNPLPLNINLGAGVKKYVDVSVICYDDRDVNEYGYLFFELDTNEAFEFCFFANYCTPEGRHYPARYSVDISIDGTSLYSGVVNSTGRNEDGDLYADAVCFALPNLDTYADDEEYIDYTLTLLDWTGEDDAYGDVEAMVISGSLSKAEIMANFAGNDDVEYEHMRFGCGDDDGENGGETPGDSDADNDGVVDTMDKCPDTPAGTEVYETGELAGCEVEETPETDSDGDGILDGADNCANTPEGATVDTSGCPMDTDGDGVWNGIDQCTGTEAGVEVDAEGCAVIPDPVDPECAIETADAGCSTGTIEGLDGWVLIEEPEGFAELYGLLADTASTEPLANLSLSLNNGTPHFIFNTTTEWQIQDYIIEIAQTSGDSSSVVCVSENNIAANVGEGPDVELDLGSGLTYPFYARVQANVCPEN